MNILYTVSFLSKSLIFTPFKYFSVDNVELLGLEIQVKMKVKLINL